MEITIFILLIIGVALLVGGFLLYKKMSVGDDVKHIGPSSQEQGSLKGKSGTAQNSVQSNSTKTAQLEALRDRLGDTVVKKNPPSGKRISSGSGSNDLSSSGANVKVVASKKQTSFVVQDELPAEKSGAIEPASSIESWVPSEDLGESAVDSFLRQPSMSGGVNDSEDVKVSKISEGLMVDIASLPSLPQHSAATSNSTGLKTNLQRSEYHLPVSVGEVSDSKSGESHGNTSSLKHVIKHQEHSKLNPVPVNNQMITGLESGGKALILLVDDSKVIRVKTEKLLSAAGYTVALAIDGIDALAKLETLRPDLVITDIEMPNLDGFGLVRSLKGNLQTNEIPVIVMTSHVNLHLDIAATEGINGFLPKPFNDQDLLDQVSYLINS